MIFSNGQRVYRTIHNEIQTLWDFDSSKRQLNNLNILTGFICGIIQSKQVKLADVVGDIPTAGKEESRIMQLKRWLKNEAVQTIIPKGTKVVILGDGEFDGAQWLKLLEKYHWHYSCRTAKTSKCYEDGEAFNLQNEI